MRLAYLLIILLSILLSGCERTNGSFVCHFGVPGGDAYAVADSVKKDITENYGEFANRSIADRTHQGKIFYVAPGCIPSFTFYEIIEPNDIQRIEELASQSLQRAGIEKVHLVFYEKQNWITSSANGAGHRGNENIIKDIVVTKAR